jgi:hypothetical protein
MSSIVASSSQSLGSLSAINQLFGVPIDRVRDYTDNAVASINDVGFLVNLISGSAISYTINAQSTLADPLPIYSVLYVMQGGAGAASIVAGSGVSINSVSTGTVSLAAEGTLAAFWQRSLDDWVAFNQTAA